MYVAFSERFAGFRGLLMVGIAASSVRFNADLVKRP